MTQPLTKEASDLAVPPLKQVELAGRGGVLTERAWQEKVDDSWQCDWWRGETTFQSGLMTRVSTPFSGLYRNDKHAEHKADAFCKYIVFPKGLNWPAHACKAPLEYERDFEKRKEKKKTDIKFWMCMSFEFWPHDLKVMTMARKTFTAVS